MATFKRLQLLTAVALWYIDLISRRLLCRSDRVLLDASFLVVFVCHVLKSLTSLMLADAMYGGALLSISIPSLINSERSIYGEI